MSRARRTLLATALLAPGLALSGCISLFPKQKPAQLYRFDVAPAAAPADPAAERIDLAAPPVSVSRAASGDRFLAITGGQEAAYVAGARWISPAAVLWDEALRRAFSERSRGVRLLPRNELAGARGFLRVDVPVFELRYTAAGAPPVAAVTLHAVLARRNGAFAAERTFQAEVPATADRLSAFTPAIDQAVERVVGQLTPWVDAQAPEAARENEAAAPAATATSTRSTTATTTTTTTSAPAAKRR